MDKFDFIDDVLATLHPGIRQDIDYLWITRDGDGRLENWNAVDFGALDWPAVQAACEAHLHAAQVMAVKVEAGRRILARYPEWEQHNMLARAAALTDVGRANWTAEQQQLSDDLHARWAWVAAVRARSNEIEVMDPLPEDVRDDTLWPA
ncbi:hypothetical protein [Pyruvatibacter sp.]|uniref:hypothetical protein n=1 Tax=Pyruvatibacter sp. TaxID=1981328 RepID=UPI0032EC1125